ncbi:hypothetical protein D3C80_1724840 [compost metagenome]
MVMPISPRNTASCHHCVTNAWGTMTMPVNTRQPMITFQLPIRSASAPSLAAVRMLPSAEQAITTPAICA